MTLTVDIHKSLLRFELRARLVCPAGKLTAMVGPSGAGKTSLIRLIAGLEEPDQGTVTLGETVWTDTARGIATPTFRRGIGLVFQEYPLFPHLTVRQNITFGAPDGYDPESLLDTFRIRHLANRRPCDISGGERQRAAFCQALARQPHLLLLDEPFSALDQETRRFLCDKLEELKGTLNIPILHVTHDLNEAERLGDEVIALEQGCISADWFRRHLAHDETSSAAQAPTFFPGESPCV
ncbi:ATP-binding cassette domain-containing protein [Pseudodesulfovibrio sp.]|uniref:ATP-binding cassette domain-containing protein n=1 Tax=unclassified Pseudodesulfovibrio TaxID=2661612 RepID=UPI003B00AFAF